MPEDPDNANNDRRIGEGLLWLAVAAALRFACLSRWSLWGDEAYSYINATALWTDEASPSLFAYPLFFVLEWLVLRLLPFAALELSLRLIPAAAGSLAVWALFDGSRGWLKPTERRFLALIAVFSPWLLFHSQFARFYSLLFLFSVLATWQFLQALRQDSIRRMTLAVLWFVLAMATHPTAAMLFAGVVAAGILEQRKAPRGRWRLFRPIVAVAVIGMILIALRFEWFQTTVGYRLQHEDSGADSPADLIQGIAYNLGLAVSFLAAVGWLLLWRHDRRLATFVLVGAGTPVVLVFTLAVLGSAVEQRYLIPAVPLMLIPAAHCLYRVRRRLSHDTVLAGPLTGGLVLLPFLPGLLSHYIDGNRHNLRGATELIRRDLRPADMVVAENNFLTGLYLPELEEERLVEAPPQFGAGFDRYRRLRRSADRCWVVVPAAFLDLGGDREAYYRWLWQNGRLVDELYRPRLDYHQNRLQVFLVELGAGEAWKPVQDDNIKQELRERVQRENQQRLKERRQKARRRPPRDGG